MIAHAQRNNCYLISWLLIALLSLTAFAVNYVYFQYPGTNYFPPIAYLPGVYLALIYLGFRICLGPEDYIIRVVIYIVLLYLTFAAIAMLTSAVQLTPFAPIDTYLISLDKALHINLVKLMAWTAKYPIFRDLLARTYDSLPWQMAILPIVLAVFGQFTKLKEYYCLLLISAIIGFSFYYFFPTTAPATNLSSPYFIKEQYDTGLKFKEIHHHISPTTVEGGMIALPSFHVIWAWLCLYLARCWLPLVIVLAPLNVLLILSCVLLGWHYFVDVLGAVFVLFLSHLIYEYSNNKKESALCLECSSHN